MRDITVIIPAFGNQRLLNNSLATWSVQRQKIAKIIVIDDGSPKPLKVPRWCRVERIERPPEHRGSSAAKNHGASLAKTKYLIFADSDILHPPDTIASLTETMAAWESEGKSDVLLNVLRRSLPAGYPAHKVTRSWDRFYAVARGTQLIEPIHEDMGQPVACFEQNCGMMSRNFFNRIGGYDDKTFTKWGYNNQDLDLRVLQSGGIVTSCIRSIRTWKRLMCFHQHHENNIVQSLGEDEFISKWGEQFSNDLFRRVLRGEYRPVQRAGNGNAA
jgi:GT2 family glycosyltransferase